MKTLSLENRMKAYEFANRNWLTPKTPVVIRVDGRSFHSFTKGMKRPYDEDLINSMVWAATQTAIDIQGFKVGYVQSDEATFVVTDYDSYQTDAWFNYNIQKVVSLSASGMSVEFLSDLHWKRKVPQKRKLPRFDSRAFNAPVHEITNILLWRAKDWERNSLSMFARSVFSHKQLDKKSQAEVHEMLHQKGYNWTMQTTNQQKNGTYLIRTEDGIIARSDILPKFDEIDKIVKPLVQYPEL
jgi:tRNA(His) 5'-end guanylyltransferase